MESSILNEDQRLMVVLTNMASEIEKLKGLSELLENLDKRVSSFEKRTEEEEKLPEISGNTFDKDLESKDIRISELESRRTILESPNTEKT